MKNIVLFIVFAFIPFAVSCQSICIEIKDRQHLPQEVYPNIKDYKAILIGEMHGTNEAPQYTEGMVNLWLNQGRKVILGLEMEGYEQSRIDSFLSSGNFSIIKRMAFFNDRFKKGGRSSIAMGNLIKWCYGKQNLKIVCLDIANWKIKNRDSMMAVCIDSVLKSNPGAMLITLTGNVHNKLDADQYGKPMGYWAYNLRNPVLRRKQIASVDIAFVNGTAWCCQPDCGIHDESGSSTWITDKCNYDNSFRIYENGDVFLFTKNNHCFFAFKPLVMCVSEESLFPAVLLLG